MNAAPDTAASRRILVVDDNRAIHQDFLKILCPPQVRASSTLDAFEASLFGDAAPSAVPAFEVHSAFQGEEGIAQVEAARREGRPYAVAFVDIRMPPGLDGVETTARLWAQDPDLQVVLCSAYADYSWEDVQQRLGLSQRLLVLRKPFDTIEARQMAHALAEKWELLRRSHQQLEELERAVAERTHALEEAHARLVQSQRLEALGQMAAGLAHEVNNPLSFVMSNLGYVSAELEKLLQGQPASRPGELRDACHDAVTGAERIRIIVQNIMRFARADEPPLLRVDVTASLEEALAMASVPPDVTLVRELREVPPVWASQYGLGQVFLNLLINAVHALRGAPRPTLRLAVFPSADGRVAVEVGDNGAGIAPEHLPRIFEPFFTTKKVGEGTGLGLSICHGIVAALGGTFAVESAPGQGSTFRVLLPPARDAHPPAHAPLTPP